MSSNPSTSDSDSATAATAAAALEPVATTTVERNREVHWLAGIRPVDRQWSQVEVSCHCGDVFTGTATCDDPTEPIRIDAETDALNQLRHHCDEYGVPGDGRRAPSMAYREGYQDAEQGLLSWLNGRALGATGTTYDTVVRVYLDAYEFARDTNPFRPRWDTLLADTEEGAEAGEHTVLTPVAATGPSTSEASPNSTPVQGVSSWHRRLRRSRR